ALLQELNGDNLTIVMVTHEADVAACATRRLVLRDGRLVMDERHQAEAALARLAALPVESGPT
ncbi:MAG: macrolide ABC transporter ATP-binding protein, partial [Planctomycetota bacterium]|nr:macrolide ABC transporter ATP-binding protein [Planctomycetota bacterium]